MGETTRSQYLTIGDVALRFNRSIGTIRRWEKAGHLTPVERGPGEHGFRYYDPKDVARLEADMRAAVKPDTNGDTA